MMAKLFLIRSAFSHSFSHCWCSCNNDYLLIAQMRDDIEISGLVLAFASTWSIVDTKPHKWNYMFKQYLCQVSRYEVDDIIYHKRQHSAPFCAGLQSWHYCMMAAIEGSSLAGLAVLCWPVLACAGLMLHGPLDCCFARGVSMNTQLKVARCSGDHEGEGWNLHSRQVPHQCTGTCSCSPFPGTLLETASSTLPSLLSPSSSFSCMLSGFFFFFFFFLCDARAEAIVCEHCQVHPFVHP